MENSKGPFSIRNMAYNGKSSLLPPKSPFPSVSPSHVDHIPSSVLGQKGIPKPREGNPHHQRTSSESFLVEEQPSWLDDLLNEPETPVRKGAHRRSSSDSFAYLDTASVLNFDYTAKDENKSKNMTLSTSWGLPDFDYYKDGRHASFYSDPNPSGKHKSRAWDASLNSAGYPRGLPSPREKIILQNSGASSSPQEVEGVPSSTTEKQDSIDASPHEPKVASEKKESLHAKASASETDTKRAKQQFAQRSRVRKLQYIAELERHVQALQAEGSDISAELEFLNQQNLILSMENKALKQRLENVAQEQLIKRLEHEVLEREIGRLQSMYKQQQLQQQQQQQPQEQPSSGLQRTRSRDLDQQFANLSLKHKEATSAGRDPASGQLHI